MKTQWISVTDRMPALYELVALANNDVWMNTVCHESHGLNWYGAGYLDGANSYRPCWNVIGEPRAQCLEFVTHWMPLEIVPQIDQDCLATEAVE